MKKWASKAVYDQTRRLIERKDFTGMEEVIDRGIISSELKELILEPQLFGGIDVTPIGKRVSGGNSLSALDYLRQVLNSETWLG